MEYLQLEGLLREVLLLNGGLLPNEYDTMSDDVAFGGTETNKLVNLIGESIEFGMLLLLCDCVSLNQVFWLYVTSICNLYTTCPKSL